jgi:hypothetical protein
MHILSGEGRGRGFVHTRITIPQAGVAPELKSEYVTTRMLRRIQALLCSMKK